MKIIKNLEIHMNIKKIIKIKKNTQQNNEIYENPGHPCENDEKHENLRNPIENH